MLSYFYRTFIVLLSYFCRTFVVVSIPCHHGQSAMFDLCFCEIILQKIQMAFSGSANALLGRCPQLFVMYVCDVQLCYDSVWHLFQMLRRIQIRCIGERPRCFAMFHNMDTQTPHADGPYVAC